MSESQFLLGAAVVGGIFRDFHRCYRVLRGFRFAVGSQDRDARG